MYKNSINKSHIKYFLYNFYIFLLFIILYASFNWAKLKNSVKTQSIIFSETKVLNVDIYKQLVNYVPLKRMDDIDIINLNKVIEAHPYVKAARISNHYPNKILIEIIEREPLAILKVNPIIMIDDDGFILPDLGHHINYDIPILTNFNVKEGDYSSGIKTKSGKVIECVKWLNKIKENYIYLYENLSELKITSSDDIELILFDYPTYVYLGQNKINSRLNILKEFGNTIKPKKISDYTYLDMRYKNQIVVKEKQS
jgi:cell division protein FtsQ